MDKIILPHGSTRRISEIVGCSEEWVSKIMNGHVLGSYNLAVAMDATGLIPVSMTYRWIKAHQSSPKAA